MRKNGKDITNLIKPELTRWFCSQSPIASQFLLYLSNLPHGLGIRDNHQKMGHFAVPRDLTFAVVLSGGLQLGFVFARQAFAGVVSRKAVIL